MTQGHPLLWRGDDLGLNSTRINSTRINSTRIN